MPEKMVIPMRSRWNPLFWFERLIQRLFVPKHQVLSYYLTLSGECEHCGKRTHYVDTLFLGFVCPGHCCDVEWVLAELKMDALDITDKTPKRTKDIFLRLCGVAGVVNDRVPVLYHRRFFRNTKEASNLREVNLRKVPKEYLERVVKHSLLIDMEQAKNADGYYRAIGSMVEFCQRQGIMK